MSHPYKQHRDAERKIARTRYRAQGGRLSVEDARDLGPMILRELGRPEHDNTRKASQDYGMKDALAISDAVPRRSTRDVLDVKVHD